MKMEERDLICQYNITNKCSNQPDFRKFTIVEGQELNKGTICKECKEYIEKKIKG